MAKNLHSMERSSASHAILEASSRKRKAAKIQAILSLVTDFSNSSVLDIGTGSGHIAHELSKNAQKVDSIDVVDERKETRGYEFSLARDEKLPYASQSFDIVISNHVIEHTKDQRRHIAEIMRVLKPGGFVYLATPNKFWLSDPHYKLAFINWLPRPASSWYLKRTRGAAWDIYPLSAPKVKRMLKNFRIVNALPLLLTTTANNNLDSWAFVTKIAHYLPTKMLGLTEYFSPTLIYIIQKPSKG